MICAVLLSETIEGMEIQQEAALQQNVQFIEYRTDGLEEIDLAKLQDLLLKTNVPSILSYKSFWKDVQLAPPIQGRRELLKGLIKLNPNFIELEFPIDLPLIDQVNDGTQIILSLIDFDGMAKISIDSAFEAIKRHKDVIIKIAATPNSVDDLMRMWRWAGRLSKAKVQHIVIGMGLLGQLTRIKSLELGNLWMYGRLSHSLGEPYLPGMLPVRVLKRAFDDDSWHLGLIGGFEEKEIASDFNNKILELLNLRGVFLKFPIASSPQLDKLLLWVQDGLLDGILIEDPWQKEVIPKLNQLDASVIHVGACNSIKVTKKGLKGYHTSVEGVKRCLSPFSLKKINRVYIEGSGEITRAVIAALQDTAELIVVNSNNEAELVRLKEDFSKITFAKNSFTEDFDLIANADKPSDGFEQVSMIPQSFIENCKLIFDPITPNSEFTPIMKVLATKHNKYYVSKWQFDVNTSLIAYELWTKRSIAASALIQEEFEVVG